MAGWFACVGKVKIMVHVMTMTFAANVWHLTLQILGTSGNHVNSNQSMMLETSTMSGTGILFDFEQQHMKIN